MPAAWKHGEDFFKPTKDELLQMAKECQVRWDTPELTIPPATMRDEFALEAGVNDDERRDYDRVAAEFSQKMMAQLRSLYVEVTGDKAGADSLTAPAIISELRDKSPKAVVQEAYWRLSQERAGLIPVSTNTTGASAFERFLRLEMGSGDDFENALAATIGATRAHALRTEEGSWGNRLMLGGCPPDSSAR